MATLKSSIEPGYRENAEPIRLKKILEGQLDLIENNKFAVSLNEDDGRIYGFDLIKGIFNGWRHGTKVKITIEEID